MPLQIGDNTSEGWRGVQDLRVDGTAVQLVAIHEGGSWVELWRKYPQIFAVPSNTTLLVPSWALYADIIMVGGGGGGAGGTGATGDPGRGGKAGVWHGKTRLVKPGQDLRFTIGIGGSGGRTERASGSKGGSTVCIHENYSITAVGGEGGSGTSNTANARGDDSGTYIHGDFQVTGGTGGTIDKPGQAPGGGGGGGSGGIFGRWSPGHAGGKGGAWVRFRSV